MSAFASLRTVGRKRPSELHQALHRSRLLRPPCHRRPSSMRLLAGTGAPSLSVPMHFRADPRAPVPQCSFETLGVFTPLCLPLEFLGLSEPMEAQAMAWPHIYTGEDVVLVSEAGSGKTLAYLLPLIQRVWEAEERGEKESGQVAVVVPTQDLAVQVLTQARQLCDGGPLTCADAAGNARGSHVLVGTPLTLPLPLPLTLALALARDRDRDRDRARA